MTDATAGVHHGIGGLGGLAGGRAGAAGPTPDPQQPAYTPGELVNAGHRFFGGIASGLAGLIEKAVGQWGLPNGYVLGVARRPCPPIRLKP